jgi:hypothetical protein
VDEILFLSASLHTSNVRSVNQAVMSRSSYLNEADSSKPSGRGPSPNRPGPEIGKSATTFHNVLIVLDEKREPLTNNCSLCRKISKAFQLSLRASLGLGKHGVSTCSRESQQVLVAEVAAPGFKFKLEVLITKFLPVAEKCHGAFRPGGPGPAGRRRATAGPGHPSHRLASIMMTWRIMITMGFKVPKQPVVSTTVTELWQLKVNDRLDATLDTNELENRDLNKLLTNLNLNMICRSPSQKETPGGPGSR